MEKNKIDFKESPLISPAARKIVFSNGAIVAAAGDAWTGPMTVQTGALKRYRHYHGQLFLAGVVAVGETFGLSETLEFSMHHRETLEAVGDTTLLVHPAHELDQWLQTAPPILLAALQDSARSLGAKRKDPATRRPLELLPVRARVAATIWALADSHGRFEDADSSVRVIDLDLTREEIAHLAGTVYESVIRTLTALKKEGVIDLHGRVIRILNDAQLARVGQIVDSRGDSNDQNTVSQNRHSPNHSRPQEAS